MNISATHRPSGISRIKLFLALSRTTHGLLDMATPAFAALIWLGEFPPAETMLIGLLTTFAGYTAVYALNDVVGYKEDKKKIRQSNLNTGLKDLDSVWVRHPMAQGMLSFRAGLVWASGWAVVAAIGAYLLNPVCLLIFLAGCGLESMYCLLLKITHHRVIVSGGVKTSGGIAAIYAVDPSPSLFFLAALFLLLFFWEVGGQNVPNDWTDVEEDRQLEVKTIPVTFGENYSLYIILGSLLLAWVMTGILFLIAPVRFQPYHIALAMTVAAFLLLKPAWQLYRSKTPADAMELFNRASYFPLSLLGITLINVVQQSI